MTIDLSVVVVSYETADLLAACLDSVVVALAAHPELRAEVILVDNGSRDDSLARVAGVEAPIRLVAFARNRGFATAVNAALRLRRGRHVLLLNSDVRVAADLFARGVSILDERPEIGVLGAALVHPGGRPQRSVHARPSLATEIVPAPLLEWLRPGGAEVRRQREDPIREVEAVRGAVFFVRGEVVEKVGPFDEGYFFFLEETDYCERVAQAGYRVGHCEEVSAIHALGASSKQRARLETRIEFHRSLYRFLERRRGRSVARFAQLWRSLRNVVVVLLLTPLAVCSRSVRSRWQERAGLLLWHLRGCPTEPSLAWALDARVSHGSRHPSDDRATGGALGA